MATYRLASLLVTSTVDASFVDGDAIVVMWNDSTSAITVTKNGSAFTTTGATLGVLDTNYEIVIGVTSTDNGYAISGYSFCNSTTLNWFRMVTDYPEYPFFERKETINSPVCDAGGGVVCDIHFTGPVTVTNTTSLTSPDGTITASATSANGTVKYALSDFVYASEGQTSGSFTGLGTGKYTVYAKDANDCTTQNSVFVFFSPAEAEHYRFTWTSVDIGSGTTRDARIRIYEREYVGDVVELDFADVSPFRLNKPKQGHVNDKFYPIHPTNAILDLTSVKDYQFLPLFTQDNKKYRVVYEVNEASAGFAETWQGFIDPNVYREDFISTPYFVEIQVSDNVKTLESEKFTDDNGGLLFGDMKLIKVISHIMKKTGLSLKIRSGINIFETTHNTASTDDPLDQTYVDAACYREGTEPFNCWEVLTHILKPFGARIYQYSNQWIIEEIDRATATYAYRVFTADGVYESNSTFDPIIDVKASTLTSRAAFLNGDQSLEVIPAYGKIDVVSKLNYVGSIVSGGFEKEDLLSPTSESFIMSQGVFTSEEGFRDWTLRQPAGISGVSFGRVLVSNRGDSSRTGLKTDANESTRSVGAFFFDPEAWGGNLRNAYIESAEKPYQYGPSDELKFYFEYSTPARPEYEFMVLRMVIKVGSNYLQPDLTWGASEAIYRAYPPISNSLQKFELSLPVPTTTTVVDSTIQVRIYYYNSFFYDYGLPTSTSSPADGTDGQTDLDGLVTAGVDYDYRLDLRREFTFGSFDAFYREFYELRISTDAEDANAGVLRVGDYDATTNPKIWSRLKSINIKGEETNFRRRGVDLKFYLDNVALDALVNGQPPPEEETVSLTISDFINEDMEVELYNFDVPDITNAKNMYNNYFRLSSGAPTTLWARSGIAEALPIQQILLKVLGANHSAPTFRMTGSFINEFARIGINNYLRVTKTGSSLSATNTTFTSNLNDWTGDASGEAFAYTASNSGSAAVTLSGAENSEKLYQTITHTGGYIEFTVNVHVEPTSTNDREDVLWVLFYNGASIVHTEKMQTFSAITSADDYDFTYTAFCPGQVTRIGFYFKRVSGTGECTYQVGTFTPAGTDILEVYQIADYQSEERLNTYFFELMQISKTYISLSGVDSGGNNQGDGVNEGNSFNGAYSTAYGGSFDTTLN